MLAGIPGSGKSTWAKDYIEWNKSKQVILLSSDALREELLGDENNQEKNTDIFAELYRRAKVALEEGKNVILDATNISQKRRMHVVREFKKYEKEVVCFIVPFETAVERDKNRKRTVGEDVIKRMFSQFQMPVVEEGWDRVEYFNMKEDENKAYSTEGIYQNFKDDRHDHDSFFQSVAWMHLDFLPLIFDMPQDSKWHNFSTSRHTWHVMEGVKDQSKELFLAAVYHDVGKYYTKSFYNYKGELKRHASFIGHENSSWQLAYMELSEIGFPKAQILYVCKLIQNHMVLLNDPNGKQEQKILNMYGQKFLDDLKILREADVNAHQEESQ